MTVVIAHHRDKSLGKTDERHTGKLHGTLHYSKGTDIYVAKMFQTSIKYKTYKAFSTSHNKRWYTKSYNRKNYILLKSHVPSFKRKGCRTGSKETQYTDGTHGLRKDCRYCGSLYPHIKSENEYRVENDIQQCTYHHRPHGYGRPSLWVYECVKPCGYLYE